MPVYTIARWPEWQWQYLNWFWLIDYVKSRNSNRWPFDRKKIRLIVACAARRRFFTKCMNFLKICSRSWVINLGYTTFRIFLRLIFAPSVSLTFWTSPFYTWRWRSFHENWTFQFRRIVVALNWVISPYAGQMQRPSDGLQRICRPGRTP